MRSIDIHAHNAPRAVVNIRDGGDWHGFTVQKGGQGRHFLTRGQSRGWLHPMMMWTTEERLMDMDSKGVDVHVLSTWVGLYNYHLEAAAGQATSRDCNDDIAELVKAHPSRFAGLATLPMQDVGMAVAELERCMAAGFKGCMINDHVNGRTLDEPEFLPFWAAAERTGALVCFHQENDTMVSTRSDSKYHLHNSIGNLADRAVTFALLVFGGVMDRFPNLNVLLMHGGGYTCFGSGSHGPWLADQPLCPGQHHQAPQHLCQALLLRLPHPLRAVAALHSRHRRSRAGYLWHRLALQHGHGLASIVGHGHGNPLHPGERTHSLEKSRKTP